jgi:predicted Rossmann fold flavoprotein
MYEVIVIGGGAAGFFGAIQTVERDPGKKILILEKSNKLLSKVRVSGGGRCNVTHHCFQPSALARHYPRGEKPLKSLFKEYQAKDVVTWFSIKGIKLKTEEDGRMFPVTDSSQTIIDCFLKCADEYGIQIQINAPVTKIEKRGEVFEVTVEKGYKFKAKKLLLAIGGHPNQQAYTIVRQLGHTIIKPIPSLFTFNDSEKNFKDLMGVSVSNGLVRIAGTKLGQQGPILITHWGLSGPAVIKLSAWAAEYLHEKHYEVTALVSWIGDIQEETVRNFLLDYKGKHKKRKVMSYSLFDLPQRLWLRLCELAEIAENKIWDEVTQKSINRLLELLIRCPFKIRGKTTFKEEFVTCGGVDLHEIDNTTMESKKLKGLFFAGEVLNIDGETGGFNFQAAWTTAYLASKNL